MRKSRVFLIFLSCWLCFVFGTSDAAARRRRTKRKPVSVKVLQRGALLYRQLCASCHHEERKGRLASPLLPLFLRRMSDKRLFKIITKGKPATQMPAFGKLPPSDVQALIEWMRTPAKVSWSVEDIRKSRQVAKQKGKVLAFKQLKNLTSVVERGANQVWLMEGLRVLDRFSFANIHGGIKFSADGGALYVPSRDGWIGKYDIRKGAFFGKTRSCVYLRNVSITRDGKHLLASCWLPRALVVLDAQTLKVKKRLPVKGQISAIYELQQRDEAWMSFRDKPVLGMLNTKTWAWSWFPVPTAFVDFFIDPLESALVGTSRGGRSLMVFDIQQKKIVFKAPIEGMPHLFSVAFWYQDGKFFFATPHMGRSILSVWQMYPWKHVRNIQTGGKGFFVRTHPETPYIWADNGTDQLLLIKKSDFSVKKLVPLPKKQMLHTEFVLCKVST